MWRKSTEVKLPASVPAVPTPEAQKPASVPVAPNVAQAAESPASTSSRIGPGLKIQGEISGTSDLYIDGETQGRIRLPDGRVTVGTRGRVRAEIEAREILVEGSVHGNMRASERVRLGPASSALGTITAPRVAIDDGAEFRGRVDMKRTGPSGTTEVTAASTEIETAQVAPTRVPGE